LVDLQDVFVDCAQRELVAKSIPDLTFHFGQLD
jgi:hypothetical protein